MGFPSTKPVFESPRATTNNSQVGAASNGIDNSVVSSLPMTDKPTEDRRQGGGPAFSQHAENGTEED